MLAEAKRKIYNGRCREKRAREKVGSLQRAEEYRHEDERIRTEHTVQAVREEEQTKAAIHLTAAREAQQMELEALLQATHAAEQVRATALIAAAHEDERVHADAHLGLVQALERQRADDLIHSMQVEYAWRYAALESHAEGLVNMITTLQKKAEDKKLEADKATSEVRTTYSRALDDADAYLNTAQSIITSLSDTHHEHVHDAKKALTTALSQSEELRKRKAHAIDKAVEAVAKNTDLDAPAVLKFKDLVGLGLKVNQVKKAITQMATAAGLTVKGNMSERTGGRVVKEGGIMAQMQVVEELQGADGATLSSDGTTHRHIPQESRHLQLNASSSNTTHFLGVSPAPNHTSEPQFTGLPTRMEGFFNVYNASPLGKTNPINPRTFPLKLCEVREETAVAAASMPGFLLALAEETRSVVKAAGGETQAVAHHLGEEAYQAMPQHERQLADLFVHGGCCMHKDLNAFKGGATRMAKFWMLAGLQAPVLLMNKDNTATAAAGPSVAQSRAVEQSRGGGPKHAELSGTLFRHKDDKKGQQDSMRWFFLASPLAKLLTFPDTSNTCYRSYGEAASVLIAYLNLFLGLLSFVVDRKDSGEETNLERNVRAGLKDEPTLAEHCAMSLYSQAVSRPYMHAVHSSTHLNHLSLGPLHDHILTHIQRLIDDPDLLGPNASYKTTALDGQPWDHPDAIADVQRLLPRLPYLRSLVVEFLQGALDTWRQFTVEFAPGGTIARLTDRERELAAMPATNDRNEGALGPYHYLARTMPNISHQNGTATYAAKLTWEQDGSRNQQQQRLFIASCERIEALRKRVHCEGVAEKKTARQVKFANPQPILRLSKLKTWTMGLTMPVVDSSWIGTVRARKSLEAVGIVWLGSVYEDLEVEPEEEGADEDAMGEGRGQSPSENLHGFSCFTSVKVVPATPVVAVTPTPKPADFYNPLNHIAAPLPLQLPSSCSPPPIILHSPLVPALKELGMRGRVRSQTQGGVVLEEEFFDNSGLRNQLTKGATWYMWSTPLPSPTDGPIFGSIELGHVQVEHQKCRPRHGILNVGSVDLIMAYGASMWPPRLLRCGRGCYIER
ncbi:hypothetical protein BD309DRAFT_984732 [Dichomitus squalens]|nr:hypothetical protein BD309DRAFT_984732 [Dichomitus squalens]